MNKESEFIHTRKKAEKFLKNRKRHQSYHSAIFLLEVLIGVLQSAHPHITIYENDIAEWIFAKTDNLPNDLDKKVNELPEEGKVFYKNSLNGFFAFDIEEKRKTIALLVLIFDRARFKKIPRNLYKKLYIEPVEIKIEKPNFGKTLEEILRKEDTKIKITELMDII